MALKSESIAPECFTCLRQSEECLPIISESSESDPNSTNAVAELLIKHFWFQQSDFGAGQFICGNCWTRLNEFHGWYLEVEQNHGSVKESSKDLDEIQHEELILKVEFKGDEVSSKDLDEEHEELTLKDEFEEAESMCLDELKHEELTLKDDGESVAEDSFTVESEESDLKKRIVESIQQREADDRIINAHIQYTCTICQANCITFNGLKWHMATSHNMKACVPCCGQQFMGKKALLQHVLSVKPPEDYDRKTELHCDLCPKRFMHEHVLERHKKLHEYLDHEVYPCKLCNKICPTQEKLIAHMQQRHGVGYASCDICGQKFNTHFRLALHKKKHTSPSEEYQCKFCDRKFKQKTGLQAHSTKHTSPKQCDVCGETFPNVYILSKHKQNMHINHKPQHAEQYVYACNLCNMKFRFEHSFRRHQAYVHNGKQTTQILREHVRCDVCGKRFNSSQAMLQHRENNCTYQCDVCEKSFASSSSLWTHKQTHTSPEACDVCGKQCKNAVALRKHKLYSVKCKDINISQS